VLFLGFIMLRCGLSRNLGPASRHLAAGKKKMMRLFRVADRLECLHFVGLQGDPAVDVGGGAPMHGHNWPVLSTKRGSIDQSRGDRVSIRLLAGSRLGSGLA